MITQTEMPPRGTRRGLVSQPPAVPVDGGERVPPISWGATTSWRLMARTAEGLAFLRFSTLLLFYSRFNISGWENLSVGYKCNT